MFITSQDDSITTPKQSKKGIKKVYIELSRSGSNGSELESSAIHVQGTRETFFQTLQIHTKTLNYNIGVLVFFRNFHTNFVKI